MTNEQKQDSPSTSCFLTTATVETLGLTDDCEPLQLARHLRDEKMQSDEDQAAVNLYYRVAPVIVERSTDKDWLTFWRQHMRQITALLRAGKYELAKEMYTTATAQLVHAKATRYSDVELVNEVYEFGLKGFGKAWLPYPLRFALLKAAFAVSLPFQSIRLGLAKRKFAHITDT